MDMFDEAEAIRSTMRLCGLTQTELATQLGVSQSYVANKLRLLSLSEEAREKIRRLRISERHARALLRLSDDGARLSMIDEIAKRGMTVRECEAKIDELSLGDLPHSFSRADGIRKTEIFKETIIRGAAILAAEGVEARVRTSYADGNMYITVVVKGA